ncbi:glutamate racemase [Oxalobacteraceae bacterium CAVE-383]|nr:glutamate racemase [Oxalobacteraceae bacterium CAVE-383]
MPMAADAPIGIFDSGVGGLTVLRHIRADLPQEHLLYFADAGHAPYGDRSETEITGRSLAVAQFLLGQGIKALVVACNTATAAAIAAIRARYPALIVVGIEPGLKPAAQQSRSGHVGVLATSATLASARFTALRDQLSASRGVHFHSAACVGLADLIEQGALNTPPTAQLLQGHLGALLAQRIDTLVLGCTHYPFVLPLIEDTLRRLGAPETGIIDTGVAVSRQLTRLVDAAGLRHASGEGEGRLAAYTSGSAATLQNAFSRLLQLTPPVTAVAPRAGMAAPA